MKKKKKMTEKLQNKGNLFKFLAIFVELLSDLMNYLPTFVNVNENSVNYSKKKTQNPNQKKTKILKNQNQIPNLNQKKIRKKLKKETLSLFHARFVKKESNQKNTKSMLRTIIVLTKTKAKTQFKIYLTNFLADKDKPKKGNNKYHPQAISNINIIIILRCNFREF